MKICLHCRKKEAKSHCNAFYCDECADLRRRGYYHPLNITPIIEEKIKKYIGTLTRQEIAEKVGVSSSALQRWQRFNKISFATKTGSKKYFLNPDLIKKVCEYYIEHGIVKTRQKFKNVNIRSIIDRYLAGIKPRQRRWEDNQILDVARMARIVSLKGQSEFFNRKNANEGSIKSCHSKKFEGKLHYINGLPQYLARKICYHDKTETYFIKASNCYIAFWFDIKKNLRKETPSLIRKCVNAMVEFQRFLHGNKNNILTLIKEIDGYEPEKRTIASRKKRC